MQAIVRVAAIVAACMLGPSLFGAEPASVRVMTFNLWHGGDAGKQPLERSAAVIRAARADIVGLQETAGLAPDGKPRPDNGARLAAMLGWQHLDQGGRTAIITRFKIVGATPKKWGVKIRLPDDREIHVYNAHFAPAPYQPYQLLKIPYHGGKFLATADEAVAAAREARGEQVARLLAEVKAETDEATPVFIAGDFNEPGHLDWTDAAVKAGLCPIAVPWPTTRAVTDAGFHDAYRAVHPEPIKRRGLTWTPTTTEDDPKDRHDRIDFVFARRATIRSAEVIGEKRDRADIVVERYPSDHRAVVIEAILAEQ